jgi:hypothetical protein
MSSRSRSFAISLLLATGGALCAAGLIIIGLVFVLDGIDEQRMSDHTYTITFGHPGDDCDNPEAVMVDADNGQPLFCAAQGNGVGPPINQVVAVPGFSTAQNREITQMAESLGAHRLSVAAQHQIQDRMNQIAATLPPAGRPDHGAALWGTRRSWTGAGVALVGILSFWYACHRAIHIGKQRRSMP